MGVLYHRRDPMQHLEELKSFLKTGGELVLETLVVDEAPADVNITSLEEQRTTEWMKFHSLADFLDPNDATKTIEGYPAPKRATFIATK